MRLSDLPLPDTPAANAAVKVAREFCSPALVNHSLRSYWFAAAYGDLHGIPYDAELLYVSACLHDIGLTDSFDAHAVDFEYVGGNVAWVFAAGAGWSDERCRRAAEIVIRHMLDIEPDEDPEGFLLATSTSLDISGRRPEAWPAILRVEVVEALPRLDLPIEFLACFRDQAERKPNSTAAQSVASGLADRITQNPLDRRA